MVAFLTKQNSDHFILSSNITVERLRKKHAQKIRYSIVGIANTVLDFALLFLFTGFGLNHILANYLSTGVAMVFSFFGNRHYTFKSKSKQTHRQFVLFITFTVIGMWVIQPIVIWVITGPLHIFGGNDSLQLFIAKVVATGASFIWNYLTYSRFVFKKSTEVI